MSESGEDRNAFSGTDLSEAVPVRKQSSSDPKSGNLDRANTWLRQAEYDRNLQTHQSTAAPPKHRPKSKEVIRPQGWELELYRNVVGSSEDAKLPFDLFIALRAWAKPLIILVVCYWVYPTLCVGGFGVTSTPKTPGPYYCSTGQGSRLPTARSTYFEVENRRRSLVEDGQVFTPSLDFLLEPDSSELGGHMCFRGWKSKARFLRYAVGFYKPCLARSKSDTSSTNVFELLPHQKFSNVRFVGPLRERLDKVKAVFEITPKTGCSNPKVGYQLVIIEPAYDKPDSLTITECVVGLGYGCKIVGAIN
jgi:hypothetical protein